MKIIGMLSAVALVVSGWITSYGQGVEPEVPGDHFSLEGALDLFKKSASPEEFEKMLNSPESKVNNLDLNGDGYIDYIRVHDRYEGNVHAFILQAVISDSEYQDVAVIELEKLSNGKAVLQIVGNEDVYGVETIIEPTREVRTYAGTTTTRTVVNVWAWPSVQYVYGPYYAGWASPWGWHHHPHWWHSWRPIAYVHYRPIWRPYYDYYAPCYTRRVVYAHRIYHPYRTRSVIVHNRHREQITRYRSTRNDSDRRRPGYEDGRTYSRDDRNAGGDRDAGRRADADGNRRSSGREEGVRSTSLNRNVPAYVTPRPTELRREAARTSRSPENPEARRALDPSVNRRPVERTGAQQTPVTRERTNPAYMPRQNTELKRTQEGSQRSLDRREVRREPATPTVSRSRAYESPKVQQRSTPQRNSAPGVRSSAPVERRSPSIQNNRSARPQASPSVNRSRPAVGQSVQQRSSGKSGAATRSSEARRGRE